MTATGVFSWTLMILACFRFDSTAAWQSDRHSHYQTTISMAGTTTTTTNLHPKYAPVFVQSSVSRRRFLWFTTVGSTSILFPSVDDAWALTLTSDAAKAQWKASLQTMDDLLRDWSTVATSGDAIRTKLGTQATVSPLFQIDKALKVLGENSAEDFVEWQDLSEEFLLALSRADSMAYSANFAGGSGKPTPPAVYIAKSQTEVVEMRNIAKKLDGMVPSQ